MRQPTLKGLNLFLIIDIQPFQGWLNIIFPTGETGGNSYLSLSGLLSVSWFIQIYCNL